MRPGARGSPPCATLTEQAVDLPQGIPVTRLFGLTEMIQGHYRSSAGTLATPAVGRWRQPVHSSRATTSAFASR